MQKSLARLVIPAVLALLTSAPAFAQIRLGVDLGGLSIRICPDAPPPPRREVVIEAPSRNHVCVEATGGPGLRGAGSFPPSGVPSGSEASI